MNSSLFSKYSIKTAHYKQGMSKICGECTGDAGRNSIINANKKEAQRTYVDDFVTAHARLLEHNT